MSKSARARGGARRRAKSPCICVFAWTNE